MAHTVGLQTLAFSRLGFGCFAPQHAHVWRPDFEPARGLGTTPGPLSASLHAHMACCYGPNASLYQRDFTAWWVHWRMFFDLLRRKDGRGQTSSAPYAARKAFSASRRYTKYGRCWADDGFAGEGAGALFVPRNCCNRPFLDIDIVIVGMVQQIVDSLATLLSLHREVVTAPFNHDMLTNVAPLEEEHVFEFNMFVRMLRASKPGSKLVAFTYPTMFLSQERMFRLAQVPNVKVLVAMVEPTRWLATLYHNELQACAKPCKKTTPWGDVLRLGKSFGNGGISVDMCHSLPETLDRNVHMPFSVTSVAYLDPGILDGEVGEAARALGALATFLGASERFDEGVISRGLRKFEQQQAASPRHAHVCGGTHAPWQWVNRLFQRARRRLRERLGNYSKAGSFVAVTHELFRGPC